MSTLDNQTGYDIIKGLTSDHMSTTTLTTNDHTEWVSTKPEDSITDELQCCDHILYPEIASSTGRVRRRKEAELCRKHKVSYNGVDAIIDAPTTPRRYWGTITIELVDEASLEASRPACVAEPITKEPPCNLPDHKSGQRSER